MECVRESAFFTVSSAPHIEIFSRMTGHSSVICNALGRPGQLHGACQAKGLDKVDFVVTLDHEGGNRRPN